MRPKIPISRADLLEHLNEQLHFIDLSANSFDGGFESEAKRLAVTLRVLLHDTKVSSSLLGQLGMKNRKFVDSAEKYDPNNLMEHVGLVAVAMDTTSTRYIAMLDDTPEKPREIDFDHWWADPVFVDSEKCVISRGQLVLYAADQDGGAHVDPTLDAIYSRLSKGGGFVWTVKNNKGEHLLQGPERAAIRQIAHEILKTCR